MDYDLGNALIHGGYARYLAPWHRFEVVEETLETGASVARVARRHAVNANQVFYWRKKYREGRLALLEPAMRFKPSTG